MTISALHDVAPDPGAAALNFAARDWPVLPLHSPTAAGCSCGHASCGSVGKHPRLADGVHGASRDPATILAWWRRWPDAGVGVATGGALVVLDVDGEEGVASLQGRYLPPTPTVQTGNGWHYYFWARWPLSCRVSLLPGIDIRGQGGYVVAPPSMHWSGRRYRAVQGLGFADLELARVPGWLLSAVTAQPTSRPPRKWQSLVRGGVAEGRRNSTIASLAGHLLRRGIDVTVAIELMHAWNETRCRPPLSAAEVQRTVESVARVHVRRQGQ